MAQIFQISDGTTTIDLLNPVGNYHLGKWETGINQWKSGGIFSGSDLSNGSIPVFRAFENSEEKITIHITGSTHDVVIANLRSLTSILDNSVKFFVTSGMEGTQAYFAIKSDNETNTRYAVITAYKIEQLPEQFDGSFMSGGMQSGLKYNSIYTEVELVVTRGVFLEAAPNNPVRVTLDSRVTYNSQTFGINNSNSTPVIFTDYRTTSNITHIYRYDASATTYSSNLIGSTSHTLFPTSPAVGDILYIGTQTSLSNSGPFFNVVFNIGTAATGLTIQPEIYNGSTWISVPGEVDLTSKFTVTGTNIYAIHRFNNSVWATVSINSVTAYWLRFRITAASSPTNPAQSTRAIYSATTPYIDCANTNVAGDLDAITNLDINLCVSNSIELYGTRLYSRGSSFTSYINFADEQNPTGISVTAGGGFVVSDQVRSPSGRCISVALGGGSSSSVLGATITFDSTIANQYKGTYRAFIRGLRNDSIGSGYPTLQLEVVDPGSTSSLAWKSEEVPSNSYYDGLAGGHTFIEVFDFGIINLPTGNVKPSNTLDSLTISVYLKNYHSSTTSTILLFDLILIPVDESYIELRPNHFSPTSSGSNDYYMEIDKTEYPELDSIAQCYYKSSGNVYETVLPIGDIYLKNSRQRIWYFAYNKTNDAYNINYASAYPVAHSATVSKLNRYIYPRGAV